MPVVPERKLMTAEELYWLSDDDKRQELVKGELREMPPASVRLGISSGTLHVYLGFDVLSHKLGRVFLV